MKKMNGERNLHLLYIAIIIIALALFYYFPNINILHDVHRILFFIPVLYAAYKFRIKGVIVTTVISLLVFLPRCLFFSPYPVQLSLIRSIVFIIGLWFLGFFFATALNITGKLKEAEEKYRSLVESTEDIVYLVDRECRYLFVNKKYLSKLGAPKEQIIGKTYHDFHPKEEAEKFAKAVEEVFKTGNSTSHEHRSHGDNSCFLYTLSPMKDSKEGVKAVTVIAKDITERKQAEEKIKYISFHDALTNLYNRAYFEEEIKRLNTPRNCPLAVIMADINGLKVINDTLGHDKGDELLKNVAKMLKSVLRKEDIIARIGGDEFAVILPHADRNAAEAFCNRVRNACEKYNSENQLRLSISLGYAVQFGQYKNMEEALKQADANMYAEKLSSITSREKYIIDTLKTVVAMKDPHIKEHGERLQNLAEALGKDIGLSKFQLQRLRLLALLHDIGKLSIPDSILFKPAKLTEQEWEIVKKHSEAGYKIAQNIPQEVPIAREILYHHERWDGTGYPKGLKGKEIPILSRIISIVDAYDAMLTERPYRKAMTKEKAIQELKENAGTQFDPELVVRFIKIVEDERLSENPLQIALSEQKVGNEKTRSGYRASLWPKLST